MFENLKKKAARVVGKVKEAVARMEAEAYAFLASPAEYVKKLDERVERLCAASPVLSMIPGASHFVEILVAIIVIIALGLIFKTQLTAFITTIINQATTNATNLF